MDGRHDAFGVGLRMFQHVDIDQHCARCAQEYHAIFGPVDHHPHRGALPLPSPPVAAAIPYDDVAPAILDPHDLVALLHQHFPRHDQRTIGRHRVFLRPLPLGSKWRDACDERGYDQGVVPAHRLLPI